MKLQAIEQLSQTVKRFFLFIVREPFYETPNSKKQRRVIINIFEDIHSDLTMPNEIKIYRDKRRDRLRIILKLGNIKFG